MSERIAKGIVRKYGKRKDYLGLEDCKKVIHRRYAKAGTSKQGQTPKKNRSRDSVRHWALYNLISIFIKFIDFYIMAY